MAKKPSPPKESLKVKISKAALVLRINRKLRESDAVLRITRGTQALIDLGDFYVLDTRSNSIAKKHLDLEDYARELGVLKAWEQVKLA